MTHRRLLLVIVGVLQVILVACESSGPASSVDGADPRALRPVHDVVDRANRITQEASLFDAFNQEVIAAQGKRRKHKNKRSDPYAGGNSSGGGGSGDKNKNNKKKDEGKSSSSDVGISTMAKAIMVIMKDRRHVSGGSDKSRGLYPKELRDRVFEQLDIRNKGGSEDRDTFQEAVDRLVGKDLIRINKNGKVKLVISMDSSSRSTKRSDDDDDKDDKEDSGQQQDSGSGNTDLLQDSDRDGYSDAEEMLKGSDPNDSSSTPRDPAGDGDGDGDGDGSTGDGGGKDPSTSGGSSGVGEKCRKNAECSSGICGNKGICKESGGGADGNGGGKDGSGPNGPSKPSDGSNGSSCEIDQDCDTNVCVDSVCSRPKRDGESCDSPYDCLNGVCAKASLSPSEPSSLCCKTGEEERGVCTGQPDGSPCVLMSSSSPDATVTMVLEDVCVSSYCNLDIGGLCDTLPGEGEVEGGSGNMDGDQYARPNVPGDGSNGSTGSKGEDVSPAGSSCDAGCIAAATIPVSLFVLVVLGATAYSIKNKRDTEAAAVEDDLASDVEAPVEMADDINDPMGSSDSNDNEVQPLVAASAAVVSADDDNEDGAASENDDIVYVDQEEGSVGDG